MKAAITALFLALSTFATAFARSFKSRGSDLSNNDFQLLNLARNFESLQLAFWNQGLQNFTAEDFDRAGYPGFRQWIELFRDQKLVQFTGINAAAGDNFKNCTYMFPVTDPKELLRDGQVVTTVGVGASIAVAGGDMFFDTPLTPSQAYSLSEPMFSCPASNPPIDFQLIPPLEAKFTRPGPHKPGDTVTITWDSAKVRLSGDVVILFLSGLTGVDAPLKQTGDGVGTTTLPQGINGTAFLVATIYTGPAPIPDQDNLAIGHLVVM